MCDGSVTGNAIPESYWLSRLLDMPGVAPSGPQWYAFQQHSSQIAPHGLFWPLPVGRAVRHFAERLRCERGISAGFMRCLGPPPYRTMSITEHPSNHPSTVYVMPQDEEIAYAEAFSSFYPTETLLTLLDGAISFDGEDFKGTGNKLTPKFSTNVVLGIRNVVATGPRNSGLVVIKLNVRRKVAGMLLQLVRRCTVIECIEQLGIQRGNRNEQCVLRACVASAVVCCRCCT